MSFSKRPGHDAVLGSHKWTRTKKLRSLEDTRQKSSSLFFFWHTGKSVLKDPFPKSTEFNAEHYASLVAYPAPFHKYPEPFLCLVGMSHYYTLDENTYLEFLYENGEEMDLLSFVRTADPTMVRIGERQRGEDEPKLLDTTIGRVVPLLPVAPAHGESTLKDSVDRLFDEEGNDGQAKQGDSASGGQGVGIQPVSEAAETNIEDVVPRRQEKRKSVIVDSDEPSHPAKKLRKDHVWKPIDSIDRCSSGWNDHFFWVDAFACPASFSWHTGKSMSKDPFPQSTEFNAEYYASLVVYPAPFHKYPEPFLCLVGMSRYYTLDENTYPEFLYENGEEMDLLSFVHTADPTKVRIGEQLRGEDEPKLLDTTEGRVVPLLPVAPARSESELEDSVDRLLTKAAETNIEDLILRRQEKRKSVIVDSHEPSYPAKKLRKDHRIPVGTSVAGKSMPAIQRLLAGAVQNAAVRGEPVPSLPFVTFVISSDSSHHSGTHIVETEADSLIRSSALAMTTATIVIVMAGAATVVKETVAKPSLFATGSSSVGGTEPIPGGFSDLTGSDFLVGDIRTVIDPDSDLQKVYVPRWNVTNGSRLDDNRDCREMVDEFAPPKFFASVRGMEHDQLFAEFNVGAAR
ncbi:hypothetical protein Tco_0331852 [Tanacetum coccineum]